MTEQIPQELRKRTEQVTRDFRRLGEVAGRVVPAVRKFSEGYYQMAERAYLHEFGKLPGGHSSARIRKKRRDYVLRWFKNVHLSPNA